MDASTVSVDYLASAVPADSAAKPARAQAATKAAVKADGDTAGGTSFHAILSALNPLQYLPVVGTIYRAVTGDTIPEGLRIAGSFVFSALTGGPIGIAINAATTLAEKLTGIDPEKIAHDVAQSLGLGTPTDIATAARTPPPIQEAGTPATTPDRPSPMALPLPAPAAALSEAQRNAGLASYARFAVA